MLEPGRSLQGERSQSRSPFVGAWLGPGVLLGYDSTCINFGLYTAYGHAVQ